MGRIYAEGEDCDASIDSAIRWMEESATKGFMEAINWLTENNRKSKFPYAIDEVIEYFEYIPDICIEYLGEDEEKIVNEFEQIWRKENQSFD